MSGVITIDIIAIVALLACSFFFSGSETALTAASRARILQMARDGDGRAAVVDRLLGERERLIGAMLIGNNLVNIAASSLATGLLLTAFGEVGVVYATVVMTIVVVVFSEVLPKSIALSAPDRFAVGVARWVQLVVRVFTPLTRVVQALVKALLVPLGTKVREGAMLSGHEELRGAVHFLHREGSVVKDERDMLGGLLDLQELAVSDVMVHRTKMVTLDADAPAEELVRAVLAAPYTRLPIWRGSPENIIGVLHAKDLLRALQAARGDFRRLDVTRLARPPWFVPDTTSLTMQLKAFRRRKMHFAFVVDEYGEVMGLITLEDILEEIVGDITDEHDVVVTGVRPMPDGSVVADGGVPIRDLNRAMDWDLPDDAATTVAGLVIHEARTIPEPGQAFTFHGCRFQVLRRQRNRITSLRVTPVERLKREGV